ncbi:MAG: NADP oxidoreductase, partial [Pigmentiphaga sp.]
ASDDVEAKAVVASLVSQFGFDVVDGGSLDQSWRFERARPAYCIPYTKAELERVLEHTERGTFNAEYSWRPASSTSN